MEIGFSTARFEKVCTDKSARQRKLGSERARKLLMRLDQLSAAADLAEFTKLPQVRCHQLGADRDEQVSADLDGPYRLIFEVADDPIPRKSDGGIDTAAVHRVILIEITDTH